MSASSRDRCPFPNVDLDSSSIKYDTEREPARPQKRRALFELTERSVLSEFKKIVQGYQATANYCCGGSIPVYAPDTAPSNFGTAKISESPITAPPIALRWDAAKEEILTKKITFPLVPGNNQATSSFHDLLEDCTPATFGHRGQDVLDENYRKAGKLDRKQFSVDFHPHDYGIIDAINQLLLPEVKGSNPEGREEHKGIVAELHKLNVYSGPSGKFKTHVDTPRGPTQFGSLVVCLPHPHNGGQLRVSHNGHSTFFDWSNAESNTIKWAAFYSDCAHEVLQVQSGHRITLTYNLYATERIGNILRCCPIADPELSPLYEGARQMIERPGFMKDGGRLGFHCIHQYAHTREGTEKLMPFALKGIDMVVFSVFRSLGLHVRVSPILAPDYEEESPYDSSSDEMHEAYLKAVIHEDSRDKTRSEKDLDSEGYNSKLGQKGKVTRVGDAFQDLKVSSAGGHDYAEAELQEFWDVEWPSSEYTDIVWLNTVPKPGHRGWEIAAVHLAYGNEASVVWHYSHAVIIIEVPKRANRLSEYALVESAEK